MAIYFSKRKIRPKEEEETGELNIVPYLDILMNLIIFMLMSITGLATFGILNVNSPSYGGPSAGMDSENPEKQLTLNVSIAKNGFYVAATGGVLPGQIEGAQPPVPGQSPPTIPKNADGTYNFPALTAQMMEIKKAFPTETKVIMAADPQVEYEILVAAMDATRETTDRKLLFPDVTLSTY